ncbi:MAG TPA: cupin domain-containing protein [Vicinamibacterales bacterium]|nr:cupin domain-containing protein [Vicinamibacterales bacterium]
MTRPDSVIAFQHRDWSAIASERIAEGVERQMVWGDRLMVCRLRFDPHVVTAVHSHPHEQITLVERGRVQFFVAGEPRLASAGDVLHFPANIPHGATMLDDEVVLIDIFSPVREDFLVSGDGGRR